MVQEDKKELTNGRRTKADHNACADPENFIRGFYTLTTFFLYFIRGGRIQISLSADQHRPTNERQLMTFCWSADYCPTLMALSLCDLSGDPTGIATEPYIFIIFGGWGVVAGVDTTNCIIKKNIPTKFIQTQWEQQQSHAPIQKRQGVRTPPPPPPLESHKWLQVF